MLNYNMCRAKNLIGAESFRCQVDRQCQESFNCRVIIDVDSLYVPSELYVKYRCQER